MRSPSPSLPLEIDFLRRRVRVDETPVDLTALEFGILAALARDPGAVITRAELLDRVWGPGFVDEGHLVDLLVADLRRKLDGDDQAESLIETVGSLGFRLARTD